jgi:hypothetical protein
VCWAALAGCVCSKQERKFQAMASITGDALCTADELGVPGCSAGHYNQLKMVARQQPVGVLVLVIAYLA